MINYIFLKLVISLAAIELSCFFLNLKLFLLTQLSPWLSICTVIAFSQGMHTPSFSNHLTALFSLSKVFPRDSIPTPGLKFYLHISLINLPKIPVRYLQLLGKQFHLYVKNHFKPNISKMNTLSPQNSSIFLFPSTVVQVHYPILKILELYII